VVCGFFLCIGFSVLFLGRGEVGVSEGEDIWELMYE
jgi:hypothetical protein